MPKYPKPKEILMTNAQIGACLSTPLWALGIGHWDFLGFWVLGEFVIPHGDCCRLTTGSLRGMLDYGAQCNGGVAQLVRAQHS